MKERIGIYFIGLGLLSLAGALLFGCVAGLQFIYPDLLPDIAFVRLRPLHVSMAVSWIFLASIGGIYYFIPKFIGIELFSNKLARWHFLLFLLTGLVILVCYLFGKFGGREYWEYPPIFSIPILITWIFFGLNYFKTIAGRVKNWPVYLWMWATGIIFFLITFLEAHLWLLPYFRDNLVRDVTVQWKGYGALVGSWNMLVYGTAIFLMEKIKGDEAVSKSRMVFLLYFLGFTNLLFGWAHHIYIVPAQLWVRIVSYIISMTELLILGKIIWNWRSSLNEGQRTFHLIPARFLFSADIWVFLNLTLALAISVPAINIYTHGTHITVAHAMGSTIGINTMILLASCFFIIEHIGESKLSGKLLRSVNNGFWILNISLLIFWVALITAGFIKGVRVVHADLPFRAIMDEIEPWLTLFVYAGIAMSIGFVLILVPALRKIYSIDRKS